MGLGIWRGQEGPEAGHRPGARHGDFAPGDELPASASSEAVGRAAPQLIQIEHPAQKGSGPTVIVQPTNRNIAPVVEKHMKNLHVLHALLRLL